MLLKNIEEYDHIYIACGYTDMRKGIDGLVQIKITVEVLVPHVFCLQQQKTVAERQTVAFCQSSNHLIYQS